MSFFRAYAVLLLPLASAVAPAASGQHGLRLEAATAADAQQPSQRFSESLGTLEGSSAGSVGGYSRTILGKDVQRQWGRPRDDGSIITDSDWEIWAAYGPYDTSDSQRGVHLIATFHLSMQPGSGGDGAYVDVVNWGKDSPFWWASAVVLWETDVHRAAFPADGSVLQVHGVFMVPIAGRVKTEFRVRSKRSRGLIIHKIVVREFPLDASVATVIPGLAPGFTVIPAGSHDMFHGTGSAFKCDIAGGNEDFYASAEGRAAPSFPYMPCWKADRRSDPHHRHMTYGPYLRTPKGVPQLVTFTIEVLEGETNEVIEVDVYDARVGQRLGLRRIVFEHFGRKPGKLIVPLVVNAYGDNINAAEYRIFWPGGVTLVHHKVVVGIVPQPIPGLPAGGPPPPTTKVVAAPASGV